MNCLIKKKKSHIYSIYKEMIINLSLNKEYLKRYYYINESIIRIPKFQQYYKHYLKFLTNPNISCFYFNKLLHDSANQKAQIYFNNVYGNKNEKKENNNIENNGTIFNADIRETLENYSTTMTYDSNEQLIYPIDIYNNCKIDCIKNKIIQSNNFNSSFSESKITINDNKDNINQNNNNDSNNDSDISESLLNLFNDLKKKPITKKNKTKKENEESNKSNNISEKKKDLKIKTRNTPQIKSECLTKENKNRNSSKSKLKTLDTYSTYHLNSNSKKLSFINNTNVNNQTHDEKKKEYKNKFKPIRKIINKSQSIISNNQIVKNTESIRTKANHRFFMSEIQPIYYINLNNDIQSNQNNYTSAYKQRKKMSQSNNKNIKKNEKSITSRNKQIKQNEINNQLNKENLNEKHKRNINSYSKSPNSKVLNKNLCTISINVDISDKKQEYQKKIGKNSYKKLYTSPNLTSHNNNLVNSIKNTSHNNVIQKFKSKEINQKKVEKK